MTYSKYGAVAELQKPQTNRGSAVQINDLFALQSYFDATPETLTPQGQAVLVQPKNEAIVPSTFRATQQSGYALGLAPWSEAPVAVEFILGPTGKASTLVLKPGQIIHPTGSEKFTGFNYGLPAGWLGGGAVSLFVFKSQDADMKWTGIQSEVLFHRYRTKILAGAVGPITPPAYANLPTRFPWIKNNRFLNGTLTEAQNGQGSIYISEVTKTLLVLQQGATVITPNNGCRMVFFGTDPFGIGADGLIATNAQNFFFDIYWPDNTVLAGLGDANPIVSLPKEIGSVAANQWGFAIYAPAGSPLIGLDVDVCRWGRL